MIYSVHYDNRSTKLNLKITHIRLFCTDKHMINFWLFLDPVAM